MKALTALPALLLLAAVLTVLPSAQAIDAPPQCQTIGSSCCGIEPAFAPCCGPLGCDPTPQCKPLAHSDGVTSVYVDSSCHVHVDHKPYDCVWNCGWRTVVQGPPVTVRVYGDNGHEASAASAAAAAPELPDPCETAQCQGPECPAFSVATTDFFAYLGPHAGLALHRDCSADVWEAGLRCDSATGLLTTGSLARQIGPLGLSADTCQPDLVCICDPIDVQVAAAEAELPDPCETAQCQPGEMPDLPGPPTFPVCVTEPCDDVVCDEAEDGLLGLRYRFTSDCGVELTAADALACPHNWRPQQTTVDVKGATVTAETCQPILDCTCPPMSATTAAAEPPVQVEFVVCVDGPCPPRVSCTPKAMLVPGFTISVSGSCHVTVTQDPLPCEGTRYSTTTVGPVTVRRSYCGPGIEP